MAFFKSSPAGGKKQTPMPGPNSAAHKKLVAAQKSAKAALAKQASNKPGSKKRPGSAFSSLKSRQVLVERIKRAIWASFREINQSIIKLAKAGNCTAARTLFDFAGVYSLPAVDDDDAKANATPVPTAPAAAEENAECDPVRALFRSIGLDPEGEPEPATQGL